MTKEERHKEFLDKVFSLVGNEYTVIGSYVNAKTRIRMKHNNCGHEWDMRAGNFIIGRRCPVCARKPKTLEKFKIEVEQLVGSEYGVLEGYLKSWNQLQIRYKEMDFK